MRAVISQVEIANSASTQSVEGNSYFPREAVNWEYLSKNDEQYHCPWKGDCTFYDVVVDGVKHASAAWSYEEPLEAANHIRGHVAFTSPVEIH